MKQRKKIAILLVVTLVLQMMPLPVGSLAGVLGIFSVSQAEMPTSGTFGDGDNLVNWSVSGTTLTLTGQGASVMPYCGTKTYYDESGSSYGGPAAGWGYYANVVTAVKVTGIQTLGGYALYSFKNLTSVTMSKVTEIGNNVFDSCEALPKITLTGVGSVGDSAFLGCESLSAITGSTSVNSFGVGAFQGCSSLTTISLKTTDRKSVV